MFSLCWQVWRAPSSRSPWWPQVALHVLAGDAGEAVRSRRSSPASIRWIIFTLRHRGAAAAVAVAAVALVAPWRRSQKRWGSTTKCAFGITKAAPKGEAAQCLYAKSRHAVATPAAHRFEAAPRNAGGTTRSPNAIDPGLPSAAAPSIAAPAAAASDIDAASSTVPSAANRVAGARLSDFAHGLCVRGDLQALGVELR